MKAFVAAGSLLAVCAAIAAAQPVQDRSLSLAFNDDGTVTLHARNVTARDVLAEWARQCACVVVNADRLIGPPMTVPIAFENAPQSVVLRSLLRQAAGYTLTPRRSGMVSRSDFETIHILPVGSSAPSFTAAPIPRPMFQVPTTGSPDDEIPPVLPISAEEAVNPTAAAGSASPGGPASGPASSGASGGLPTVNVPGVRVVPIAPVNPAPQAGSAPAPAPGGTMPARTP